MVRIGTVWDRTTDVLSGRGDMLAGIAGLTLILPMLVRDAVTAAVSTQMPGAAVALIAAVVGLVTVGLTIFGQLSIVAAASDPRTLRADAFRIAARRFWPAIGLYALMGIVAGMALLPLVFAIAGSGIDLARMQAGVMPTLPPGLIGFLVLYLLVLFAVGIWVSARLFTMNPVIVNERLGLRSFARSFALTRGSALRLIGFLLLVGIVFAVALIAVQAVTGIVFRLLLGSDHAGLALFLTSIGTTLVTTAYTVVISVFAAQFYVAAQDIASDGDRGDTVER